jgi:hypothetical protein
MSNERSGALVFYGATGDLAAKKIFPALQRMVKAGTLDVPVIALARGDWTLEKLRERARESVEEHGDGVDREAFARLMDLLRIVVGSYQEDATFDALHQGTRWRRSAGALHGHPAFPVRDRRAPIGAKRLRPERAPRAGEAVRARPGVRPATQRRAAPMCR